MKKKDVQIGGVYIASVSGKRTKVRIRTTGRHGGWYAINEATGRKVYIATAGRLRMDATPRRQATVDRILEKARERACEDHLVEATENMIAESQEEDETERLDPDKCATARCGGVPMITHLGRPLCQECWQRQADSGQPGKGENTMPATKTTKKADTAKKATKHERDEKGRILPLGVKGAKAKAPAKATKVETPAKVVKATGQMSGLDAAAKVLTDAGEPMSAKAICDAAIEKGLWAPKGKTPAATLYSAMFMEIKKKGDEARFTKVDRGMFSLAAK
jgi:hypothetical protein